MWWSVRLVLNIGKWLSVCVWVGVCLRTRAIACRLAERAIPCVLRSPHELMAASSVVDITFSSLWSIAADANVFVEV